MSRLIVQGIPQCMVELILNRMNIQVFLGLFELEFDGS